MLGSRAIFLLDNYKSPGLRLEDQPMMSTGKPFQENLPEILITTALTWVHKALPYHESMLHLG